MSNIKFLKKRHGKMKGIIDDLESLVESKKFTTKENARMIRKELSKLAGIIKLHMQREDKYLYPDLLKSNNQDIQQSVQLFIDQMGDLDSKFDKFNSKYLRASLIAEREDKFRDESLEILSALKKRIVREDK